jgi:hypothetical protein
MSLSFVRSRENHGSGRSRQVLIGEAVADVMVEEGSLGIGLEKLLIAGEWYCKVAIAFPGMELDLQAASPELVIDPFQQG